MEAEVLLDSLVELVAERVLARLPAPSAPEPPPPPAEYLTTAQASAIFKVGKSTLEQYRMSGKGPPFVRVGSLVRYSRVEFEQWMRRRK